MQAKDLRTDHMTDPVGIDGERLFFSWVCEGGLFQTGYRVRLALAGSGEMLWDSGVVESGRMHVLCPVSVGPRTRAVWTVQLWDENGSTEEPAQSACFETGLYAADWQAKWVCPELTRLSLDECDCTDAINAFAKKNWEEKQAEKEEDKREAYVPHQPASYIRKKFHAPAAVDARLYITACGVYVAYLNGKRVGDMVLAPGTFTADHHVGVQTYDVSGLVCEGENEIMIVLGDGWYRSTSGVDGDRDLFGADTAILFQLEADGQVLCVSDETMEASQCGPVRQNDMQQGEVYDARITKISGWHGIRCLDDLNIELRCTQNVPIREHEAFAGRLFTAPDGSTVLDFGQNIAGYIEIEINAHEGQQILLTCGEALDAAGNFTDENFQDRKRHKEGGTQQYLQLICREGINHFKPSFTIMGFQYALVETDIDPDAIKAARFTAHAVYSDMAQTGTFECSDPYVNKLVQNSIWSLKGNFCDVPTDCPTRERAAWTGDMGVFAGTGLYLMDCYPVIEKWLGECRQCQYPDGRIANIAPPNGHGSWITQMLCSSAGWGDACIIVPYTLYERFGDIKILEDNYDMMRKWYAFLLGRAAQTKPEQESGPYAAYTVLNGIDYGEWCEPGISSIQAMSNPKKSVGTAYLAYSGRLLAQIADILGKPDDADEYRRISELAGLAYRYTFTNDGVIESDRQAEYVRAVQFGLLTGDEAAAAVSTLDRMIRENDYHLNTGFLSTPFMCGVLCEYGYTDTAYRLLLQDTAPGWLYAVKKGANTIWETWEGIDADGNPHESLNHYSYGAICGWLFGGVCGINIKGSTVTITPVPDPHLRYARAAYDSPLGRIESGWSYEADKISYQVTIPSNVTALFTFPDGSTKTLTAGSYNL